jgi:catechol 2,3-dioxygenase
MSVAALPDKTRLSQVHLKVATLTGILPFYQKTLGLVVVQQSNRNVVLDTSEKGPGFLHLTEDPQAVPHPRLATGLYHFAILYPTRAELAHALKRLILQNWAIDGASNHLVSEAIYLRDPENNGIELYVDVPRSQWKWRDGQVEMTTESLDLQELLATDGIAPTPQHPAAATQLGHIHLHVTDLRQAELFFHELLGFAVTQRSYPGALFLSAGGYHHHIGANTWAGKASPPPNSTGLISYRFEIPDAGALAAIEGRAPALGFEVVKAESAEGREVLRLKDPSASWFEIALD